MSTVWMDILTPKQVHYFGAAKPALEEAGCRVTITTRDYGATKDLLASKKIPNQLIGRHGGGTLEGKLAASLQRQKQLHEHLRKMKETPEWSLSLCSPEASRVAFGLGIRILLSNDAPHAEAVCRLTLPLANYVVTPACIPKRKLTRYGIDKTRIVQYHGVDEVAWIRGLKPDPGALRELGLEGRRFVLVRPEETKAAYLLQRADQRQPTTLLPLIDELVKLHPDVATVVLPRYPDQRRLIEERFRGRITIPDKGIDAPSIMAHADLVVSGGGTMDREAALLGTPAICSFPLGIPDVERYLIKKGLPLWFARDASQATSTALRILKDADAFRMNTREILDELESPIIPITQIVTG